MFDLAVGLNNSATLRSIKHHMRLMNVQFEVIDAIRTFLLLKGVNSYNTIRSFNITADDSINIVLGTQLGDINISIRRFQNHWHAVGFFLNSQTFDSASSTICKLPILNTASSDSDPLRAILIQGPATITSGNVQPYTIATDPPFYLDH